MKAIQDGPPGDNTWPDDSLPVDADCEFHVRKGECFIRLDVKLFAEVAGGKIKPYEMKFLLSGPN